MFLTAAALWRAEPRLIASRATMEGASLDERTLGAVSVDVVSHGALVIAEGFEAEFSLTNHQVPTLGVQVTMAGARVVYSADTGPQWAFPATFRVPGLAIVECTYEARDEASSPFHLDAREAAALVSDLSPRCALLTHVPPGEDGDRRRTMVQRRSPRTQALLARAGMTLDVEREPSL